MAVGFIALYQRLGMFECTLPAIAASVGIMSFATAVFESLPVNNWLDDNLSVPLLAVLLVLPTPPPPPAYHPLAG